MGIFSRSRDAPALPRTYPTAPPTALPSGRPGARPTPRPDAHPGLRPIGLTVPDARMQKDAARTLLKDVFLPLLQDKQPYVNLAALNRNLGRRFTFHQQKLDWRTGETLDAEGQVSGERYFCRVSTERIWPWLEQAQAIDKRRDSFTTDCSAPRDKASRLVAEYLLGTVGFNLIESDDGGNSGRPALLHTTWGRAAIMINDFLGQMDTKPIDWRLEKLYRQCETPTLRWLPRKQSPEKPHVVVNISQDTPFKENQLCTSELSVLVYFLVDCALRAVHTPHAIYPVMCVAASWNTVRVTQAVWDVRTGTISIQIGPILEFPKGLWHKDTIHQYLTLLGWIISDPVGTTR